MTKLKYALALIAVVALSSLFFYACGDDSDSQSVLLDFEFDFRINDQKLVFGQVYDLNESKVSFKVANYYIGGLQMTQEDGAVIDLSADYLLAGPGNIFSAAEKVPNNDIVKFDFFIGVDEASNSQTETDFTSRPSTDPLGMKDPSMHWNWNSGYKFLRVDGEVDTEVMTYRILP